METTIESRPETLTASLAALHGDAFGWALSVCGRDRTLAEEVVQMAYVKALSGEARFDGRSSLKTWLFGVIRVTAASERRKRWMSARGLARFTRLRTVSVGLDPEETAGRSEAVSRLVAALKTLSPRQREVLHLTFQQGMTIEAAAQVMGIGIGSARVHYERGKAALRRRLSAEVRP